MYTFIDRYTVGLEIFVVENFSWFRDLILNFRGLGESFDTFKISQILFSRTDPDCENCEKLLTTKIPTIQ